MEKTEQKNKKRTTLLTEWLKSEKKHPNNEMGCPKKEREGLEREVGILKEGDRILLKLRKKAFTFTAELMRKGRELSTL